MAKLTIDDFTLSDIGSQSSGDNSKYKSFQLIPYNPLDVVTKVTITYTCKGNKATNMLYAAATAYTGYLDSSNAIQWGSGHTVGGTDDSATTYTDTITPVKTPSYGYVIAIGAVNNINKAKIDVSFTDITVEFEYTPHEHSYSSTVTKAATCTSAGSTKFTCACGDEYTDNTKPAALGHSFGSTTGAKAATCLATGNSAYKKCSRCNLYFAGDAATNSTAGKSDTSSFVIAKNPNNHTGGTEVKNAKAATCSAEGYTGDTYCKGCGVKISSGTTIAKKAHTEVTISAVAATCTATGLTEGKKCSVCNTITVAQTTVAKNPNNHTGGTEVRNAKSATCTATGYTGDTYCKGCGAQTKTGSTIAKLAHTEITIPAVAATCTATGLAAGKKCSVCGTVTVAQQTVAKNPNNHTGSQTTLSAVAPTCTDTGKTEGKKWSCCNAIITAQQTVPAKGHSYTSQVIAATAAVDGYTLHTCQNGCGSSYKDNYTINKIFIGTSQPKKIYFGTQEVKEVYFGTTKVYGPR